MRRGAQEFAEAGQLAGLEHLPAEFSDLGGMPESGDFQLTVQGRGLVDAARRNGAEWGVRRLRRCGCWRAFECPGSAGSRGLVCQMHDPSLPLALPRTVAPAALQFR